MNCTVLHLIPYTVKTTLTLENFTQLVKVENDLNILKYKNVRNTF